MNDNLIKFDTNTAREMGRRGGKAKARKIAERKSLAETLRLLLTMPTTEGCTTQEAVAVALLNRAMRGDVRAFEAIRDSCDGKPTTHVEAEAAVTTRLVFFGDEATGNGES